MKFIICALYYNNSWKHTSFDSLSGDESGFYVDEKGFNFGNFTGLNNATKYDYETAIKKLDMINTEYGNKYPKHGFVIMSDTFRDVSR